MEMLSNGRAWFLRGTAAAIPDSHLADGAFRRPESFRSRAEMKRYAARLTACLKSDVEKINGVIACCGKDHPEAEKTRESLRSGLARLGHCFMVFGEPVEFGPDGRMEMGAFTLVGGGAGFSLILTWHKRRQANPSTPFHIQVTRLLRRRQARTLRPAKPCCSASALPAKPHRPAGDRDQGSTGPWQDIGRNFMAIAGRSFSFAIKGYAAVLLPSFRPGREARKPV